MKRIATCAALLVACGPIYGPPNNQPQPQPPSQPPGGLGEPAQTSDPWTGNDPRREPRGPETNPRPEPRQPEPRQPEPRPEPRQPEPVAPGPPPPPSGPIGPRRPEPPPTPDDARSLLAAHNRYRANHCAAPLSWSVELERAARAWADSLRDQGCKFGHSGGRYGENLAAGTSGTLDGEAVTAMWYDEIKQFDFARGGFSMDTGHFTQVVWRATTQLGCAKSTCRGMDIWVCEYDPPGNVEGGYRANVRPTNCK